MKNHIRNTQEMNPLALLLGAMANPDGHIEAMEAQGQRELVGSEVLPVEYNGNLPAGRPRPDGGLRATKQAINEYGRELLTKLGFKVGSVVENDGLFQHVEFPEGWTRKATEHSMWSSVLDASGAVRMSIFYKAAYYDRSAHYHFERAVTIRKDYGSDDVPDRMVLSHRGQVVQTADIGMACHRQRGWETFTQNERSKALDEEDKAQKTALAALKQVADERWPGWDGEGAYNLHWEVSA